MDPAPGCARRGGAAAKMARGHRGGDKQDGVRGHSHGGQAVHVPRHDHLSLLSSARPGSVLCTHSPHNYLQGATINDFLCSQAAYTACTLTVLAAFPAMANATTATAANANAVPAPLVCEATDHVACNVQCYTHKNQL